MSLEESSDSVAIQAELDRDFDKSIDLLIKFTREVKDIFSKDKQIVGYLENMEELLEIVWNIYYQTKENLSKCQ